MRRQFVRLLPLLAAGVLLLPAQERGYPEVPYVPTPPEVVEAMLRLAGVNSADRLYDLGCGDGRIVVLAAKKFGARATGVDIDKERIEDATRNAKDNGVVGKVDFIQQDLFQAEISDATVVTLYLLSSVNMRLRPKLLKELKPGTRVVSHSFDMGDWKPHKEETVSGRRIMLWIVGKNDPK
jgi:ubiquinone/menaquinone biosynthesis C-methylase UbiE